MLKLNTKQRRYDNIAMLFQYSCTKPNFIETQNYKKYTDNITPFLDLEASEVQKNNNWSVLRTKQS